MHKPSIQLTLSETSDHWLSESLQLALPAQKIEREAFTKTRLKPLNRRGLMWLGQTCNLRCYFCYYLDRIEDQSHPEHAFMPLEKAREICRILVEEYGNNSIDIQGGEPTLWKPLPELIRYCDSIGMKVTVITNGIALSKKELAERYRDAGIRDVILSIQGLGPVYDEVVGRPNMWQRQMKGLRVLQETGIPFRFNTVLSSPVLEQLPAIAELACQTGARVVNFLAFNPFDDQTVEGRRNATNVPRYSDLSGPLGEALDYLEKGGIEANVRYLPYCMLPERYRNSIYNFQQIPYDLHENEFGGWTWTNEEAQRTAKGPLSPTIQLGARPRLGRLRRPMQKLAQHPRLGPFLRRWRFRIERQWSALANRLSSSSLEERYREEARQRARENTGYCHGPACKQCDVRLICDGFNRDYADLFGTSEARPIRLGQLIDDPTHYVGQQEKTLFPSDAEWVLAGYSAR
jgi:MoaA/NifB/PqqE/SkfB family radical SAM enzyme